MLARQPKATGERRLIAFQCLTLLLACWTAFWIGHRVARGQSYIHIATNMQNDLSRNNHIGGFECSVRPQSRLCKSYRLYDQQRRLLIQQYWDWSNTSMVDIVAAPVVEPYLVAKLSQLQRSEESTKVVPLQVPHEAGVREFADTIAPWHVGCRVLRGDLR